MKQTHKAPPLTAPQVKAELKRRKIKPMTVAEYEARLLQMRPKPTREAIVVATAWAIMFGVVEVKDEI